MSTAVLAKIFLDARDLEHPIPLEKAIKTLRELNENNYFYMIHRKNPIPLIALAERQGLKTFVFEEDERKWHILFTSNHSIELDRLVDPQYR